MILRILTVAVALFLPTLLRADDAPKGDKELDGDWELQTENTDGQERPLFPDGFIIIANFQGLSETAHIVNTAQGSIIILPDPSEVGTFTLKIQNAKKLNSIDTTVAEGRDKGAMRLGIYEIRGEELHICEAPPEKDRPTEFSSKEGTGWTLKTFKRVKK